MSKTGKVLTIIFSILIILAFAFVLTWGIINFNKVKDGMSGTGLYTQGDLQAAYEDGYSTALTDKEEYDKLINSYRDTITTQTDLMSQLNSEVQTLKNGNRDYAAQIETLNEQKTALETQIDTLNAVKENNEKTINDLNGQIAELAAQVVNLQAAADENEKTIKALNSQIENLQSLNSQLQATNELNLQTISGLNAQIVGLNNQITDLTLQMQNNSSVVNALNNKIAELQKSISYYEQYLQSLESGEQVVATFEFAGSVYNIQVVNKNSLLTVTTPTSTAYVIFNGWTVDGAAVDLSTYRITQNTKFIADVTYKYEVNFTVDGENYNNQIVVKDNKITVPAAPTKSGYVFEGWTMDGNSVVNLNTYTVTQNVTFTAKFTKLYSVIFKYEDNTLKTDTVKSGNYATAPTATTTAYKVFNGWKVNGVKVNINEYRITADTVFTADITYKYDVKFMSDGKTHNTQIVEKFGKPTVPATPSKTNYVFVGWTLDGTNTVNVADYVITANTTFTALFRTDKFTVTFKNGNTTISTQEVQNGGYASKPAFDSEYFCGWTVNGYDTVNLSTYKITANTTFTAKFGTWTRLGDNMLYVYGDSTSNSAEIQVKGLKAGDKIKITANFMQTNITDTGDNSYWYNSATGNGCYGWQYYGEWIALDEYGNLTGAFDLTADNSITLKSTEAFTSTLGVVEYGVPNEFTITISCKRDGYLTVEWSNNAGFYLEMATLWELYVIR